jgi:hypothetical protein
MKAAGWIDRVKVARGWNSDYRVAKELHLSRQAVSDYRGKTVSMDEDTAIKVAGALGERPEAVLLDQYAERTKNPQVRSALLEAASRLCILCLIPEAIKMIADYARENGATLAHQ